eukprot:5350113-Alexandrium_andersonii.AAC.1
MSASLVGSEMCIRDRRIANNSSKSWGSSENARAKCVRPTGAEHTCLNPVSYTHLTLPTICSV